MNLFIRKTYMYDDWKWILGCIFIFIVLPILAFHYVFSGNLQYYGRHDGEHIGYVTAVEQNTTPFLAYQNNTTTVYVKTDLTTTQEDEYCIPSNNQDLINQFRDFAKRKVNVIITYDNIQFNKVGECQEDTVTKVEELR